jgi:hypothetical protein
MKLRDFQGTHVRGVRLIQQRGEFAEHSVRLRHSGDLDSVLDNDNGAFAKEQQPVGPRTARNTASPA